MLSSIRNATLRNQQVSFSRQLISQSSTASISRSFSTTRPASVIYVKVKEGIPPTTEKVPDVETFLTAIGRKSIDHAETIGTWEKLMTITSQQLKAAGVDIRSRRYILTWREKFTKGDELYEIKRGKKSWGGERRRKAVKAEFLAKQYREEHHRRLEAAAEQD